jgi:SAM-dependent methyltransferase
VSAGPPLLPQEQDGMEKHTGSSFNQIADRYAQAQDTKPWDLYFERPGILRFLPDVAGKDVLDAGCGPGFYSQVLADQGARVAAFDLNPAFVQRTQQRTGGGVKAFQADLAEPLSFFSDASFDLVVCILVLHYIEEWRPVFAEFHRVLRSSGRLIFSTHHPCSDIKLSSSGDYFATEKVEDEWEVGKVQFYRRPLGKITQDLFYSGFRIEEIFEPQPVKPPEDVIFAAYEKILKTPMRLLFRACKVEPGIQLWL